MSRKVTKHPPTGGWRAPNGQMAPMEPARFEAINLDNGTVKRCARCGELRAWAKPCPRCEEVGQP